MIKIPILCNEHDRRGNFRQELLSTFDMRVRRNVQEIENGCYDLTIWVVFSSDTYLLTTIIDILYHYQSSIKRHSSPPKPVTIPTLTAPNTPRTKETRTLAINSACTTHGRRRPAQSISLIKRDVLPQPKKLPQIIPTFPPPRTTTFVPQIPRVLTESPYHTKVHMLEQNTAEYLPKMRSYGLLSRELVRNGKSPTTYSKRIVRMWWRSSTVGLKNKPW